MHYYTCHCTCIALPVISVPFPSPRLAEVAFGCLQVEILFWNAHVYRYVDRENRGKERAIDRENRGKERAIDRENRGKERAIDRENRGKERAIDRENRGKERAIDREELSTAHSNKFAVKFIINKYSTAFVCLWAFNKKLSFAVNARVIVFPILTYLLSYSSTSLYLYPRYRLMRKSKQTKYKGIWGWISPLW